MSEVTETVEPKRTRKLGQLTWCRCDDRDGWLQAIPIPGMESVGDMPSAKKLLAEYLTKLGDDESVGQRFRLIRDIEEVVPKVEVHRKVSL
jgi:hypothetical protein